MQYRLVRAVAEDEAWLESLRRSVYQELFRATWGGWDEERHLRQFSECLERGQISIIEADGVRAGMIQVFDESGGVEIGEIQVQLSHQNGGLGTCVLRDVVSAAHERGKSVRLRVGLKNENALRLYRRLGFRLVAQSDTHHHLECALPRRFSHVAVTVPAERLKGAAREELLSFYGEVFGWHENAALAIPGQRLFLRAPSDTQYITLRASETPMQTSGYEHLGVLAEDEADLRAIHQRASALASRFPELELSPIESEYGNTLRTFRLRFRLPLTIEVQYLRKA